jgi:hypothetical protein
VLLQRPSRMMLYDQRMKHCTCRVRVLNLTTVLPACKVSQVAGLIPVNVEDAIDTDRLLPVVDIYSPLFHSTVLSRFMALARNAS